MYFHSGRDWPYDFVFHDGLLFTGQTSYTSIENCQKITFDFATSYRIANVRYFAAVYCIIGNDTGTFVKRSVF